MGQWSILELNPSDKVFSPSAWDSWANNKQSENQCCKYFLFPRFSWKEFVLDPENFPIWTFLCDFMTVCGIFLYLVPTITAIEESVTIAPTRLRKWEKYVSKIKLKMDLWHLWLPKKLAAIHPQYLREKTLLNPTYSLE